MKHLNCGGTILFQYTASNYCGLSLDKNGDTQELVYDEPGDEIINERYQCQECDKVWYHKEEMMKEAK
jgi:hypothetical protein